jgi:hypothetical protein
MITINSNRSFFLKKNGEGFPTACSDLMGHFDDIIKVLVSDLVEDYKRTGFFNKVLIANLLDDVFKAGDILTNDFDNEVELTGYCVDFDDVFDVLECLGNRWSGHPTHIDTHQDCDGIVSFLVIDGDGESLDDASVD